MQPVDGKIGKSEGADYLRSREEDSVSEEFSVVIRDPFGNVVQFESINEMLRFVDQEEVAWGWLETSAHDPADMRSVTSTGFAQFRSWIENLRSGAWTQQSLSDQLSSLYGTAQPTLLMSDYAPGSTVLLIKEELDANEGEIAYSLATARCPWNPVGNLRAARLWNMLASPALIGPDAYIREHQTKLGSLRGGLRRVVDNADQNHENSLARQEGEATAAQKRYRKVASYMVTRASRRADRIEGRAVEAIKKINDTDTTFTLHMGLEAPVRYWRTKHRQHQTAWKVWGAAVLAYLLAVGIAVACIWPTIWNAVPVGEALTGRHILLVTSIGAALTLIFWVARLLIRIFLGERHLATDAEERRVMTQAYLALMKAGAASNEERSIILASLFRGAQDGIVREEGAQDFTVPALLAKLLDSRKLN